MQVTRRERSHGRVDLPRWSMLDVDGERVKERDQKKKKRLHVMHSGALQPVDGCLSVPCSGFTRLTARPGDVSPQRPAVRLWGGGAGTGGVRAWKLHWVRQTFFRRPSHTNISIQTNGSLRVTAASCRDTFLLGRPRELYLFFLFSLFFWALKR